MFMIDARAGCTVDGPRQPAGRLRGLV